MPLPVQIQIERMQAAERGANSNRCEHAWPLFVGSWSSRTIWLGTR